MTGKVFQIKQSKFKIGQLFYKCSNLQLFGYLQIIQVEKPWGLDEEHLPDFFNNYNLECKSTLTQDDLSKSLKYVWSYLILQHLPQSFYLGFQNSFQFYITTEKKAQIEEKLKKGKKQSFQLKIFREIKFKKNNKIEHKFVIKFDL